MPALKVPPAPVSTPTARSSRASSWSNARARARAVAPSTALRTLGRLMVITRTPSASWHCTGGASEVDIGPACGLAISVSLERVVVARSRLRCGRLAGRPGEPGRLLPRLGQHPPALDREPGGTALDHHYDVFRRQAGDSAGGPGDGEDQLGRLIGGMAISCPP